MILEIVAEVLVTLSVISPSNGMITSNEVWCGLLSIPEIGGSPHIISFICIGRGVGAVGRAVGDNVGLLIGGCVGLGVLIQSQVTGF